MVVGDVCDCVEIVEKIKSVGGDVLGVYLDVGEIGFCEVMVVVIFEKFGCIDVLVNNVVFYGGLFSVKVNEIDEEDW